MRFLTLLLLAGSLCCSAFAAEPPKTPVPPEFQHALRQASEAFERRDWDLTEKHVEAADKMVPNHVVVWNFRGALAVERGKFAEAEQALKRALEIDPKAYVVRFNLTEVPFREKKYAESRERLEKLRADYPKDELVLYKIFLTYLFEKDVAGAEETLAKIPEFGTSPAYYFAKAALAFSQNKAREGEGWIRSSSKVFNPRQNELFASSLREVGWLPDRKDQDAVTP